MDEGKKESDTIMYYQLVALRRHGGLIVSVLVFESSGPRLSHGRGHCIVFLGKTLSVLSQCLSHPRVLNWVSANLMLGITL